MQGLEVMVTENHTLFEGTTFTELESAIAEQVAIAAGRAEPNLADMLFAVEKAKEWNANRARLGLPAWV